MLKVGQRIKSGYIYGEVHKILEDNYYMIKFGLEYSSPNWFKRMHRSEFYHV